MATPGMIHWAGFVQGRKYRVRHQIPGVQKLPRDSVMKFVSFETTHNRRNSVWSARPVAGTQEIDESHIIEIWEVDQDTPITLNDIIRPEKRVF